VINDIDTGAEVNRFSLAGKMDFVQSVDWARAGGWIAVGGTHVSKSLIALVKPDGTGFRSLAENGSSPLWGASGRYLYFLRPVSGGADLFRFDIDQRTGRERGPPRVVLSGLPVGAFGVGRISLNQEATTLVYEKAISDVHIWATTLDGALGAFRPRSRQLTSGTRQHATPDLSGDGKSVTFVRGESGAESLFVLPFAGTSAPRWVPTPPGRVVQPRWSPDAARIAFGLRDSSRTAVFMATLAGDSVVKIGTRQPTTFPMIAWSPDGNGLVFAVEGLRELVLINLIDGRDQSLGWKSSDRVFEPRFSPDGKEILATSFPDVNVPDVLARTSIGSDKWVRTPTKFPNIRLLRWTPDGWVYAAVFPGPRQRTAIYRMRGSGGSLRLYTELPVDCDFQQVAMSVNARQFVCAVERSQPDVWMVQNFDLDRQ
jgi:Tol biopolymer transport system component